MKISKRELNDRIRGSLIAGAAGDALGYAVEFDSRKTILSRFGERGISQFSLCRNGKALISDDTQMTLFTAAAMLVGLTRGYMRGIGGMPEDYVFLGYRDWYYTQMGFPREYVSETWLAKISEMSHRRAPGITCLKACENLVVGREVENNSKGCGGIMRVAPMGLLNAMFVVRRDAGYELNELARAGAAIAKVTHKHPLGYLPAALLTLLVNRVAMLPREEIQLRIIDIIYDCHKVLDEAYCNVNHNARKYLRELTDKAIYYANKRIDDDVAIRYLGEGWTAEESWAIAIYCVVRHIDSVEDAIIAAVNHDGDSDSVGSIVGNIMGAIYGFEHILRRNIFCPEGCKLENTLELYDIILAIADDLSSGCVISEYTPIDSPQQIQWYKRYCEMQPAGIHCKYQR